MSNKRRLRIRAIRRKEPDLRKLSRALIELASARAEADAAAAHRAATSDSPTSPAGPSSKEPTR
jgi:hypothetical protein